MPRKKRSTQKHDTVRAKNATFYAKRTTTGRFREMDEMGRSLKADRLKKAEDEVEVGLR